MISFSLLCLPIATVLAFAIFLLLNHFAQFSERTVEDVEEMIRPQDREIDSHLFDPAMDKELRRIAVKYRRKQRIRLDLGAERYRCKHHNVRLLLQWANTEWKDVRKLGTMDEYTEKQLENLLLAIEVGKRFYWLASFLRVKMWVVRIILRLDVFELLETPDIAPLRRFFQVDMLNLYQEFKAAMVEFARMYGDQDAERLKALL